MLIRNPDFLLKHVDFIIKTEDVGAALGVLDVMNSGVGVVSPLLGGLLLGQVGSGHTATAGAVLHAMLAMLVVYCELQYKCQVSPRIFC